MSQTECKNRMCGPGFCYPLYECREQSNKGGADTAEHARDVSKPWPRGGYFLQTVWKTRADNWLWVARKNLCIQMEELKVTVSRSRRDPKKQIK